jgi:hypothetical protein
MSTGIFTPWRTFEMVAPKKMSFHPLCLCPPCQGEPRSIGNQTGRRLLNRWLSCPGPGTPHLPERQVRQKRKDVGENPPSPGSERCDAPHCFSHPNPRCRFFRFFSISSRKVTFSLTCFGVRLCPGLRTNMPTPASLARAWDSFGWTSSSE